MSWLIIMRNENNRAKKKDLLITLKRNKLKIIMASFVFAYLCILFIIPPQIFVDEIRHYDWVSNGNVFDVFPPLDEGCVLEMFFRPLARFYMSLSYFLFGNSFYGWKLITTIILLFTMLAVYKTSKLFSDRKTALIMLATFVFLNTIVPNVMLFSSRIHALLEFLFIVSSLFYLKKLSIKENRRNKLLFILLSALAFISRETSYIIIPAAVLLFPLRRGLKKEIFKILLPILLAVIFFDKYTYFILLRLILNGVLSGSLFSLKILGFLPQYSATLLILAISTIIFLKYLRKDREKRALAVIMLIGILIPFMFIGFKQTPLSPDYFAVSLFPSLFFISIFLARNGKKRNGKILAAFLIILMLFGFLTSVPMFADPGNNWYYEFEKHKSEGIMLAVLKSDLDMLGGHEVFNYSCYPNTISRITKTGENNIMFFEDIPEAKPEKVFLLFYPWANEENINKIMNETGYGKTSKYVFERGG